MKLRLLGILAGLASMLIAFGACGDVAGLIPAGPPTPTPCAVGSGSCASSPEGPSSHDYTPISTSFFDAYYNKHVLTPDSSSTAETKVFTADTAYGTTTALLSGSSVADGSSARSLLQRWVSQHIDQTRFTGMEDKGQVHGAEIGYQAGSGEAYSAIYDQPGVPNFPVYIQVIAATKGTTGIVFAMFSPLDPLNPDPTSPRQVRGAVFDQLLNTVSWH